MIFKETLDSINEFDKPEKVGNTIMVKEADAIIYQIQIGGLEKQGGMPFEIGLGDPKDREELMTHLKIREKTMGKLQRNIQRMINGLLWLDKSNDINLSLDEQQYLLFSGLIDEDMETEKNFQEMLERYGIKKLWAYREEKGKEIFERMEKIVWDTQTSAFAQKQGMTNTEFLRWRLIGAKLGEIGKKEDNIEK